MDTSKVEILIYSGRLVSESKSHFGDNQYNITNFSDSEKSTFATVKKALDDFYHTYIKIGERGGGADGFNFSDFIIVYIIYQGLGSDIWNYTKEKILTFVKKEQRLSREIQAINLRYANMDILVEIPFRYEHTKTALEQLPEFLSLIEKLPKYVYTEKIVLQYSPYTNKWHIADTQFYKVNRIKEWLKNLYFTIYYPIYKYFSK